MFQKILAPTRALPWTCCGAHSAPFQTPSWIDWPSTIKWQPTIELISPTIKNLSEIPGICHISYPNTIQKRLSICI